VTGARRVVRRLRAVGAVALALWAVGCGPSPAPRSFGLEKLSAPAPRSFRYLGALENRKSEPYAPLTRVSSVAVLPDGTMFYSDLGAGRIHRFDPQGEYLGTTDDPGGGFAPLDMVTLGFHLYVLDRSQERIYRFNRDGALRDTVLDIGRLANDQPVRVSAIDLDRDGRIALADEAGHRVLVTSPFLDLEYSVGEYGRFLGQLNRPWGVCFGSQGFLYVADRGNGRVQVFDSTGQPLAATEGLDAPHPLMTAPSGMDADRFGNLYVCDPGTGKVQVLAPDLVPLATIGGDDFAEDHLINPVDCCVGPDDRLYVVDMGRNTLLVYQIVFP